MNHKKTRVLVATPLGSSGRGGIDRIMDGVRVELARSLPEGVSVRFCATRGSHILVSPFMLLLFILKMILLRIAGCCDVVHVNVAPRGSNIRKALICRLARILGIKTVVHLHGSGYDEFWRNAGEAMRKRIYRMFSRADLVIVLGSVWRQFILAEKLADAERVLVLPNASARASVAPQREKGAVRVLFLGVHGARKGTPQLIEALATLKGLKNWRAVLAGNGDVEGTRSAVVRFDIGDRVSIPGWVGPEETERLLASSDVLVLPSFAENLPMSVIEGMSFGLAVLTTPVGATPDIIKDGETGLLVSPGDVVALSAALQRLITDEDLRFRLGNAAQTFHRQHLEMEHYAERLCMHWRQAAAG